MGNHTWAHLDLNKETAEEFEAELLKLYRAKGVKFISLPDAMSDPAYRDDPDIGEPGGGTFLELMMQKKKIKFPANSKPYKELEAMCR